MHSDRRSFRYGLYLNPQRHDPVTPTLDEAELRAKQMSVANNGAPVAVWDEQDRTLKLFAGYEEFVPA